MSTSHSLPFDTRATAHDRIASRSEESCASILRYAWKQDGRGLITDELSTVWNCSINYVTPHIGELAKSGRLIPTKRARLTRIGSSVRVYVLQEFSL